MKIAQGNRTRKALTSGLRERRCLVAWGAGIVNGPEQPQAMFLASDECEAKDRVEARSLIQASVLEVGRLGGLRGSSVAVENSSATIISNQSLHRHKSNRCGLIPRCQPAIHPRH